MQELRLVAVNDGGTHLVLGGPDGREFLLPIDERLSAAARRDKARLGQLEIELEPQLRPREIQSRIRAGGSVQEVAAAAQVHATRIERYAGPVLAERAHIADAARKTAVRRRTEGPPEAPLGELVEERLERQGFGEGMIWDAWRRDDGRWTVRLEYRAPGRIKAAHWVYDPAVRVVSCSDDEARWLTEDHQPAAPPAVTRSAVPRLMSVPREEQRFGSGETADELDSGPAESAVASHAGEIAADVAMGVTGAAEPVMDEVADLDIPENLPAAAGAGVAAAALGVSSRATGSSAAKRSDRLVGTTDRQALKDGVRPGKRATVPAWDDIVFGRKVD